MTATERLNEEERPRLMEIALIVIILVAIVSILYFVNAKKPADLPAAEARKALPEKEPRKKEGPSLQDKLEQRRSEMAKPEKPKAEMETAKADASPAAKPEEKPDAPPTETAPEATAASAQAAPEVARAPAPPPEPKREEAAAPSPPAARGNVEGLRRGLAKSRGQEGFFGRLASLVAGKKEIDPEILAELEEVLLSSDVGVKSTEQILSRVRDGLAKNELSDPEKVWEALRSEARRILSVGGGGIVAAKTAPTVVMMVGVNGAGKTTTIGKIATKLVGSGQRVVLAAGDTFRAAAVQQLEVWGKRVGCEVVKGKDGADPAAVTFDAVTKAKASSADIVLVDTAGRLHTKTNLMDELKKIGKSLGKAAEGAPHETLLVIDATNGQNALAQATQFKEAMSLTGIVLTKLDGTAKGGVILAICDELQLPVRYVGLGERPDDLHEFAADEYVEALFGTAGAEKS